MIDLFQYPFIQRAFIGGVILGLLLGYVGIFVVLRNMSFFASGIAHGSLAGIALALITGLHPLATAMAIAVVFALLMYLLERYTTLSADAIINIVFVAGMSTGIILISTTEGYQPELLSFLFGNILTITYGEILLTGVIASIVIGMLIYYQRRIVLLALNKEMAHVAGVNIAIYDMVSYVCLAISIVLGIKMLGVVLVSALLVLPVSTAKLFSTSFKMLVIGTITIALLTVLIGLPISYYADMPSGAVLVVIGSVMFALSLLFRRKFA